MTHTEEIFNLVDELIGDENSYLNMLKVLNNAIMSTQYSDERVTTGDAILTFIPLSNFIINARQILKENERTNEENH